MHFDPLLYIPSHCRKCSPKVYDKVLEPGIAVGREKWKKLRDVETHNTGLLATIREEYLTWTLFSPLLHETSPSKPLNLLNNYLKQLKFSTWSWCFYVLNCILLKKKKKLLSTVKQNKVYSYYRLLFSVSSVSTYFLQSFSRFQARITTAFYIILFSYHEVVYVYCLPNRHFSFTWYIHY